MGTDIHLWVEEKWSWDTEWRAAVTDFIFVWRDYDVFRLLVSDVREDGITVPISDPRGIPCDAHEKTRNAFGESGFHSVSWITPQEFRTTFPWRDDFSKMSHFALQCYLWLHSAGPARYGGVRFIFGFDS